MVVARIVEDETNGGEEVGFAGPIAPDNNIVFTRKRFDDRLVLVAVRLLVSISGTVKRCNIRLEALNDNLLDIHRVGCLSSGLEDR